MLIRGEQIMNKKIIYFGLAVVLVGGGIVYSNVNNNYNQPNKQENLKKNKGENLLDFKLNVNKPPYKNLEKQWETMDFDKYFLMGAQQAWTTWSDADKVWMGVDYSKYNYALSNEKITWIASPDKNVIKIKNESLSKDLREQLENPILFYQDSYKNYQINGTVEKDNYFDQPYDSAQFKSLPKATLHFAINNHEAFHSLQGSWKLDGKKYANLMDPDYMGKLEKSNENREAREIRSNILDNLRQAILFPEKEQQYLQSAKYWNEKYLSEHKEDADFVKGSDIFEGSARYFDAAMSVRSSVGMNASKETIFKTYQKLVKLDFPKEENLKGPEEAYELGGFSGILLEKKNKNLNWQSRVEEGETLVDILLENYEAKLSS